MTNGTMDLTDSALRELERNKQQGANANKSTLIIHSVQRVSLCLVSSFCFFLATSSAFGILMFFFVFAPRDSNPSRDKQLR